MSLDSEVAVIRQVPILSAINPAQQKLLCFSSERLTFEPGEVLFREGEAADAAYVLIEGAVEITIATRDGPRLVNTVERNDMVGETAIYGDVPRTATATAKTHLETLRISQDMFCELMRDNAQAALHLNRILARRLANTTALLSATLRAA